MKKSLSHCRGSAMVFALLTVVVLSVIAGSILTRVSAKYTILNQASSWQGSMMGAEAGVDIGMAEIRKWLADGTLEEHENPPTRLEAPAPYSPSETVLRTRAPGVNGLICDVVIDAPRSLYNEEDQVQWFRIRAIGISEIPGGVRIGDNTLDSSFRKVSLVTERQQVAALRDAGHSFNPMATRIIEVIAKPKTPFSNALTADGLIDMNGNNVRLDSYDSSKPGTRSEDDGSYDEEEADDYYNENPTPTEAFYGENKADSATNGSIIDAGNADIYGDALTNAGTVFVGSQGNVYGETRTDFYQDLTVTDVTLPGNAVPRLSGAIQSGVSGSPTVYQVSDINLSGQSGLHIQAKVDAVTGAVVPSEVVLYVTGNINISGQASITIDPTVKVTIYVAGNVDAGGNGIINNGANATNLEIYGITSSSVSNPTIKIHGNGVFKGAVYAPEHSLEIKGGGSNGVVYGAFVVKDATLTGNAKFIYDEALAKRGRITDYTAVSWYEDTR